jgi:hypothetical protein
MAGSWFMVDCSFFHRCLHVSGRLQDQGFVGPFFLFFESISLVGKLTDALFLVSTPDDATLNLMDELDTAVEEIIDELSQPVSLFSFSFFFFFFLEFWFIEPLFNF